MIKKYFVGSILFSVLGLIAAGAVAAYYNSSPVYIASMLFTTFVLAILEISLSFDNAIVNATVLKNMTAVWRHRFLTWGIIVAVFGMRLIFPVVIVAVMAKISPWAALSVAIFEPEAYAKIMLDSHLAVSAFGGAFLALVGLKFFYDAQKDEHWIRWLEKPLSKWGSIESLEIAIVLLGIIFISRYLGTDTEKLTYLLAGVGGILTFIGVHGLSHWLELSHSEQKDIHRASLGMFIYLEVLDASFSFDGVVGAFAITNNLFIIMIGLSIGAFFVRSLTIMFVEENVLTKFEYLEHGAFYAILVLAAIMMVGPLLHIPEWFTGLSGAIIIGISFWSSLRKAKLHEVRKKPHKSH